MGKGAKLAIAGVVLAGAGAGAVAYSKRGSSSAAATEETAVQLSTVEVAQRDLITYDETTATLGFTVSVDVTSPVEGTVTTIAAVGDTIDAGTMVATIDGEPVVALIGDVPGYRDLSTDSSDGADVRQLEQNLVLLGFDPDGAITIDEEYDDATADAVTLWEDILGLEGDGEVPQSQVVYVPGRLLVDTVSAPVGGAAATGSTLLVARQAERKYLIASTVGDGGTVGTFAAGGTEVVTGTVLFWENYVPVVAIEGDPAATPALARDLSIGVDDGADIKLLEQMLIAGGFDQSGTMIADDHFDDLTAYAVVVWQQSLGLPAPDGAVVVPKGSYVVVPADLSTGTPLVAEGTTVPSDAVVLALTSPAREVTTTAPIGDDTFALAATIDVEFPDGTVEPGTVVSVGNVASSTSDAPGATPTVEIGIHVDDIPASVDSFVQIPVTLRVVAEQALDAFVVPVSALVALAEGGYAIEKASGGLIGVEPGLFADGFVAVTGDGLEDGLSIVVPS